MKRAWFIVVVTIFGFLFGREEAISQNTEAGVLPSYVNTFEGQHLVTFGNSITYAPDSWAYRLKPLLGFADLYNGSLGSAVWSKREQTADDGTLLRTQNYGSADYAGMSNGYRPNPTKEERQKRLNNCAIVHVQKYLADLTKPYPDHIIFSYGTNDATTEDVLGDVDVVLKKDRLSDSDLYTIAGAVRWCIDTLRKEFPKTRLYVALPLQAESVERNQANLKKIAVIRQVCESLAVPCFDCFAESGITQANQDKYLRDGLHPNAEGARMHADYIMRKLIEANTLPFWALGEFVRPDEMKPVISPDADSRFYCSMRQQEVGWEESDTFNPAAVTKGNKIVVLYRAEDNSGQGIGKRTSRIGYAETKDGVNMKRRKEPVLFPAEDACKDLEWPGGCEDPRVAVTEDGLYVMLYTAWNRKVARLSVATSRDLVHWEKHGLAFGDAYGGRFKDLFCKSASILTTIKDGKIVIEKLNGQYFMYWGEYAVYAATSDDLIHWTPVLDARNELRVLVRPRKGYFDSDMTECGPPALLTEHGIVLLYNGKNSRNEKRTDPAYPKGAYCAGQMLFDAHDPYKLIDRLDKPFFYPEASFEKSGQYANGTVFIEGLAFLKNKLYLYYGCADSRIGVAMCDYEPVEQ